MVESIAADPWYVSRHRPNNYGLSFDLKKATLGASASVVSVRVHLGETQIRDGSGFVVKSITINGKFISTVLTSASIVRSESDGYTLASDIKVIVILSTEITCEGVILACDFHFNVAVIKIETDAPITTSRFGNVKIAKVSEFDTQSRNFSLVPGDTVIALGRYHEQGNELIVEAGIFSHLCYSVDEIELDCQELLKADLIFPRNGIGGPLINSYGEVIGMNFYYASFTPFLPINIVSMCWEQLETNGRCPLPRLGLELFDFPMGSAAYVETVVHRFPDTFNGVAVGKITLAAPAYSPEILPYDVIVGCDGIPVGNILELFEVIRDKVGQAVHFDVVRPSDGSRVKSTVVVGNIGPGQVNRWPVPRVRKRLRVVAWA